MKIIAEVSITPIGVGVSFSEQIAECERIFKKADLKIQLHAQGTNIEGEFDDVMKAIKESIQTLHAENIPRLSTNIQLSTRIDKDQSMNDKVKSVEKRLQ